MPDSSWQYALNSMDNFFLTICIRRLLSSGISIFSFLKLACGAYYNGLERTLQWLIPPVQSTMRGCVVFTNCFRGSVTFISSICTQNH